MHLNHRCLGGDDMTNESFEIGQSNDKEWHFQLKAPDGEVLIQSEDYSSKEQCVEIIQAIKRYSEKARIITLDSGELH